MHAFAHLASRAARRDHRRRDLRARAPRHQRRARDPARHLGRLDRHAAPASGSAASARPGRPRPPWAPRRCAGSWSSGGSGPSDIGALIVATVTPDMVFPATACLIQDQVGPGEHLGLRPLGRVLRLSLRAHDGRAVRGRGHAPARRRGRGRSDERDHRSARPNDRRPVRRRRGRRAARAGRAGVRPPRLLPSGGRKRPR